MVIADEKELQTQLVKMLSALEAAVTLSVFQSRAISDAAMLLKDIVKKLEQGK